MANDVNQVTEAMPTCPVCHKSDQVKSAAAAYEVGVEKLAPPKIPHRAAKMMPWILLAALLYGGANFYLLIQLGGSAGLSSWPIALQVLEIDGILVITIIGLACSFIAFQRLLRADDEEQRSYTVYDQAMQKWQGLYYCLRDKVVFDPKDNKVLSEEALHTMLNVNPELSEQPQEQVSASRS